MGHIVLRLDRVMADRKMTKSLQVMNELKLVEDFPVDNITIFERRGSRWEA